MQWWSYVKGADWRHPTGPGSSIVGKDNYPVVQIAYPDAEAYAKWAHKRLPTEAQWEFAARGGLAGKIYDWGNEFHPNGKWMANTHQGHFPDNDAGTDGYVGLAPVAKFPANGYGLYDMAGNVWQWTADWYRSDYYAQLAHAGGVARNPSRARTLPSILPSQGREKEGPPRRIIPLHRPILLPLHGRNARQRGDQLPERITSDSVASPPRHQPNPGGRTAKHPPGSAAFLA